jgi:hypothetical protein
LLQAPLFHVLPLPRGSSAMARPWMKFSSGSKRTPACRSLRFISRWPLIAAIARGLVAIPMFLSSAVKKPVPNWRPICSKSCLHEAGAQVWTPVAWNIWVAILS